MCTVVVSFAADAGVPLLLVGVRDEFTGRPWQPPAAHWPEYPVAGGLDLRAGGTWLAVHRDLPVAACILNGRGREAPPDRRRSRGDLPLRAASGGPEAARALLADPAVAASYDPFHLVCAGPAAVTLLSWDGRVLADSCLAPGTHLLTNAGLAYSAPEGSAPADGLPPHAGSLPLAGPAPAGSPLPAEPRAAYFGPRFAAVRPPGTPGLPVARAWRGWLGLAAGAGLADSDPRALIVRHELSDGRVWGSTSVSLVSLAESGVRYDFRGLAGPSAPAPPAPVTLAPVTLAAGLAARR